MIALRQAGRRAVHAGALIFGAWCLVATSAPAPGPARDCFTGIAPPTRLQVVLGATLPSQYADVPSCGAIDGLAPGSALTFDISQGPRPKSSNACYEYDTDALAGVLGVMPQNYGNSLQGATFTSAYGSFTSPDQSGCRGDWVAFVYPESEPPRDQLISPLDAGTQQQWVFDRRIGIAQAQFCGAGFTQAGAVGCNDSFAIASITELAAR